MADQRIDQLTADASPLATDIVYVEHDPSGTPADRKVTVADLLAPTTSAYGRSLIDDADAATARSTLGLGSIATQAASSIAVTGGTVTGVTLYGSVTGISDDTTLVNNSAVKVTTEHAVKGYVDALPSLASGDSAVISLSTVAGPPAVTTMDVSNVVSLTGTQTLTNKEYRGATIEAANGGPYVTVKHALDVTFGNDGSRSNIIEVYGNASVFPVLAFCHQGGSASTPAATASNGGLGRTTFRGYDGSALTGTACSIFATAAENFTATNHGAYVGISTTPTGSTQTLTEVCRFTAATNVAVRNGITVGTGSGFADPTSGYGLEVKAGAIGYGTGTGGTQTQTGSRTTTVVLNKQCGAITLVSGAGSTTEQTFTLTNSTIAATDVVLWSQKSGTDKYIIETSAVAAGSCTVTYRTFSGTTTEQPVFNFVVVKAVAA